MGKYFNKNYKYKYIFSILVVLFSIAFFPGYFVAENDQVFYTAPVKKIINPNLYQNDFLVTNAQTTATFFDEIVALTALNNTEYVYYAYFILTILTRFLFFLGIFELSYFFTKNLGFAYLAPILFVLWHRWIICNGFPFESFTYSFDTEMHARAMAMPLLVYALAKYLNKQYLASAIFISLGILTHIISAIPAIMLIGFWTLYYVWNNRDYKQLYFLVIPASAFIFVFIQHIGATGEYSSSFFIDTVWKEMLMDRTSYLFLYKWFDQGALLLRVYLPLIALFALGLHSKKLDKGKKVLLSMAGITYLLCLLIHIFGAEIFNIALIMQLQFLRSIHIFEILVLIVSVYTLIFDLILGNNSRFIIALSTFTLFGIVLNFTFIFPFIFACLLVQAGKTSFSSAWSKLLLLGAISAYLIFDYHHYISDELVTLRLILEKVIFYDYASTIMVIHSLVWPTAILATALLALYFTKSVQRKIQTINSGIIIAAGITVIILISFNIAQHTQINPITFCNTRADSPCILLTWIENHIRKEDTIAYSNNDSSFLNDILRNILEYNVFVSMTEGAQGTFNRGYMIEWNKRMEIASNPEKHIEDLKNYGVDYYISNKPLNVPWEKAFEYKNTIIYKL